MDNHSGQTLVELALVLPCICLGVFMGVQLMWCCHNMVQLQRMAQVMADRVTYENYLSRKKYTRFKSLWGTYRDPWAHFTNRRIQPWRPFKGKSTVQEPGRLLQVHVDSDLLPGEGFTKVLRQVTLRGHADGYLEPPIPPEE